MYEAKTQTGPKMGLYMCNFLSVLQLVILPIFIRKKKKKGKKEDVPLVELMYLIFYTHAR